MTQVVAELSREGQTLTLEHVPRILPAGWTRVYENTFRHIHRHLLAILTVERERDGRRWVHVSVSHRDRIPTWDELRDVKEWLIGREALAVQVLPRASEYVNICERCLHLWHCLDGDPVPDFRHEGQI